MLLWTLFFLVPAKAQDNLDLSKMIGRVDSTNIFKSDSFYTWCASAVKGEDGKYYLFYSRWRHGVRQATDDSLNYIFNGFRGWNKYSEIAYAVADQLTGPYKARDVVLKGTGDPSRWDRFTYHNPLIKKFNGWYYLYFISNSFDTNFTINRSIDRQNLQWLKYNCTQKIGVIKARTIHDLVTGKYQTTNTYLMAPDNIHTFEVATNPAVTEGPDGKYYMIYKSRQPNVGHMTFWMATADSPDGPFKTVSAVLNKPEFACEDPTIWYDKRRKCFYAVAKYFSQQKKLSSQFGSLILLTSANGIDWEPAKHTQVTFRQINLNNRIVQLSNLERPFVYINENGTAIALFAAASILNPFEGDPQHVDERRNTFNVQIPLQQQKHTR